MPAGVSWNTYLKGVAVMLVSMAAGSQTVHLMYKPLEVQLSYMYSLTHTRFVSVVYIKIRKWKFQKPMDHYSNELDVNDNRQPYHMAFNNMKLHTL